MASKHAARKRIRVSKNRKKTWKKHINLKEIEEHIEEKRKDEITGGPVGEKPNEKLFFVEKDAQHALSSDGSNWKTRSLRCFQILQPDSLVPPPVKPRSVRKHKVRNLPITENPANGKVKGIKKRMQALKNQEYSILQRKEAKLSCTNFETYDLWGSDELHTIGMRKIDPKLKEVHEDDIRIRPCKVPKTYLQKTSALPAVEVPDPGASYNPAFDEYQQLMHEANEVEIKKLKEEHKLQRAFTKFPNVSSVLAQDSWLQEMSQGILDDAGDEESEEDSSHGPFALNPPVRGDRRKPANKRRREAARQKAEVEAKKLKMDVQRENEVYRIRSLKAEIVKAEQKSEEKQIIRRAAECMKAKYLPAVISRYKYETPDLEINLSSELTGSLRTLMIDGNVLLDRFKSFQRRNILEPRVKQRKKRKYKLKEYVKRGHESDS